MPLVADFAHVPFGDMQSLEAVMSKEVAAFIVEPIQGEGGVNVPPDDYLPAVRELCTRNEALLILDEVQTGFGRTGALFACQHAGVVPDIITLAKALGGGVMSLGAFASTPEIWKALEDPNPYLHTSTLGGNPLACAAGAVAIREIVRQELPARARTLGAHAMTRLQALQAEHSDVIGEVRGRGLLIGVEFTDSDVAGLVIAGMLQRRVIAAYALNNPGVVRIEPALTISQEDLDRGLDALRESVVQTKEILAAL
jgi:putrescine aminotransferase